MPDDSSESRGGSPGNETQPDRIAPWRIDDLENIGHSLTETARRMPTAVAVACPRPGQTSRLKPGERYQYDRITFGDLDAASNRIANGLVAAGVRPGIRVALMVPPGIDFVSHVFALYKTGAVTILIDPGMGRKNLIRCLEAARPESLVGIPKAHLARLIFRRRLKACRLNVVVGGWFPGCRRSSEFTEKESRTFESSTLAPISSSREDAAAIIFTTGSTGPPKGVLYRHRQFIEQAQQIRDYFEIQPGTIDVSGFPLFALFNVAMGTTTVFPEMDATRPAEIHPPNLIDAVSQFHANQSFGSPALWNTVSRYCEANTLSLPTMQRVLTAGAPVPPNVLRRVKQIISPQGDVYTPYGATEALPVACIAASRVLAETAELTAQGAGTCVGYPFERIRWRLIEISDAPLIDVSKTQPVAAGEIGELMVQGPVVTDQYVTQVHANAEHKVADGDQFWHRMGDVGYLDDSGRFWFCGRKTHRVQSSFGTLFTIPCESIFNTHPDIYRSALVGAGNPGEAIPVIIVEPHADKWPTTKADQSRLKIEILDLAKQFPQTESIHTVLLKQKLPVDIRHNSKIFREQLKPWAERQLGKTT